MSVKIYDKEQEKWIIFPGTIGSPGKDAYLIAQENGYTGNKEEYSQVLVEIPKIAKFVKNSDEVPTQDSPNLVKSGGTWSAINTISEKVDSVNKEVNDKIDIVNTDLTNKITTVETSLTTKINNVETSLSEEITTITDDIIDKVTTINNSITEIKITEIPNQIKESIINDLESTLDNKSLSANQGRVLKEMIGNLVNLSIQVVDVLPATGKTNIIYLVKKEGVSPNIHDEYVFVDNKWEKIGNTEVDLSNYYTKAEVNAKIPIIPGIEVSTSGIGNVITEVTIDETNKHKINAVKKVSVYSKQEVDDKFTESSLGDVKAATIFTTVDRVITSNGVGKVIKDSGILLGNLSLKSELGALATKDKINESDLNFSIPTPITVDTALSTTSENPVQNKVITTQLNNKVNSATLGDYYNKTEVDSKISEAGGGDVLANGSFTDDHIILGSGNKAIKGSGMLLSSLATQTWVRQQGFTTSNTWRPIEAGGTTLNDSVTALTIANGIGIGVTFNKGTLTIINTSPGISYTLPIATNSVLGGIKIGHIATGSELAINLSSASQAYVNITSSAINSALGFTPANVNDIPEIPVALPNPYPLSININSTNQSYNGSSSVAINLDNIYSKKLTYSTAIDNIGDGGYIHIIRQSYFFTGDEIYSEDKPDSVIVAPYNCNVVTSGNPKIKKMDGFDDITATSGYKCYCFTRITEDLIFGNVQIYN